MRGVVEVILFREAEAHCTRCSDKIERVEGESLQAEKTPLHCVRCCVGKCGGGAGKKKGGGGGEAAVGFVARACASACLCAAVLRTSSGQKKGRT